MAKKIMNAKHLADLQKSMQKSSNSVIYAPLSKSVCAAMLAGAMVLGGGVFVSTPLPAYADGYVAPDGNIYYGYKSDSNYSKERFKIEVHYYSNKEDADNDTLANQDPLGQYVHVKYTANLNDKHEFDKWAFRPMWWYGVPAGLTNVHNINYSRFEKYTNNGKPSAPSTSHGPNQDSDNVTKHYRDAKDWKSISRFYITDPSTLTSKNGLAMLLGVDGKNNSGYDSKGGTTAGNWKDFYEASKGMQGMFVDWESAGKRFYEMDYVAELTENAWKNRDEHPLRFAAGVYRFAGNWHIATGQIHRAPKIADSLKVAYPSLTPVAKADALNDTEKTSVKDAIKTANKDTKHFNNLLEKIDVANDGTATLTFHDNTTITMPGKLLVVEDKKDNVKFPPVYPAPIGVVKPKNLSEDDQKAIIDGFKKANADKDFLKKVKDKDAEAYTFDNNKQELTINYKDGSSLTIPYDQLVYQGATIADWAPYVVPDPIEVTDPSKLTEQEKKQVTDAFDKANADLDVYTAAEKDGKTPVTFDDGFKNAIITWADGSQTKVPSWQFLTKKPAAPTPGPVDPTPTPAGKKTFTVDLPTNIPSVKFDPFNATQKDITDNQQQLNTLKAVLKKCAAKDAKDGKTAVTIKEVEYAIVDGKGVIKFKAEGYEDAIYPMSVFFKQMADKQTPQTPSTETKTKNGQNEHDTFTYKVTKTQFEGDAPTVQDAVKALKQFVKDNYDNVSDDDLATVGDSVTVNTKWIPKTGTKNMGAYGAKAPNDGPMTSFSLDPTDGFAIKVNGHSWADNDDGGDWDSAMEGPLFTIKASDLYVKKGNTQQQKDNTIDNLKQQAKDLLQKRTKTDGLTNDDLKRAGIEKPDELNDSKIDGMSEKELRDLIRKLTDAKKAERKYNPIPEIEVADPESLSEADFKKAAEAFLKANYDGTGSLAGDKAPYTVPTSLTPKTDTALMELASDTNATGISSIKYKNSDFKTLIFTDKNNNQLFTVSVKYKKKAEESAPTPDALVQMRDDAKKIIDKNPYLTPEQKKQFKKQIDDAKDQPGIQKILNDAKAQGEKNKKNTTDPNVQQIINNNKGGGDEKKQHELDAAKEAAKKAIEALKNLSNDEKQEFEKQLDGNTVKTPADVQKIVDAAKLADELKGAKDGAQKEKFVFLDHGTAKDEDAALNSVLDSKSEEDPTLKALAEKLKEGSKATAADIRDALNAAKRANDVNEQNAKRAATAKLDALEQSLEDAYNKLSDTDKTAVNAQYTAAKDAITKAKTAVTNATKPSELLNAINGVTDSLTTANNAVKEKIDTEHNNNKKNNDHSSDPKALQQEKDKAKQEIDDIPGLTEDEKNDYKKKIEDSTHSGDPEAIVNQAKKHKKIEDALKKLDEFRHLNDAQKQAFKDIINDTDAHNHTDADGKDLGIDDIDVALANAANTDNAMARLEDLKAKADEFAKGENYKGLQEGNEQKKAFDDAATAAGAVLDKAKGDSKGADEVNTLYNDLLKAMRAIDPNAQSAGLKTDALAAEIESDKKLKPDDKADPKTPGDSVYTTASADKKAAFDKALGEAQTVLNGANTADISTADKEATEQNEIDVALDKLIKARLALDGVNTKPLQDEINKDSNVTNSDKYKYATTTEKKTAFDTALSEAKNLINNLTTPSADGTTPKYGETKLDTKENKQKALGEALKKLQDAVAALDGKEQKPTPAPSVDKSGLKALVDAAGQVKDSDAYKYADANKQGAYDKAISDGQSVLAKTDATADEVTNAVNAINTAKTALDGKKPEPAPAPTPTPTPTPSVDKSGLQHEIANSGDVKKSDDYNNAPSDKKQAYDHALDHANEVNNNPNATQDQVNQAAEDLKKAENDLKPTPTPTPTPSPLPTPGAGTGAGTGDVDPDSEAGYGVNDNAPTTVDKGELNIQIDSAEADSQPGNAGAGNAGNTNAGAGANSGNAANVNAANANAANANAANANAANANANAANGANAAAVNAAVESNQAVKQADAQVSKAQAALDAALAEAKKVAADPNATQAQVDAAARKLAAARKALATAKAHAADVRASVRAQVLKSGSAAQLSKTGSDVSVFGLFAATISAAGAALFAAKRRGISRHSNK